MLALLPVLILCIALRWLSPRRSIALALALALCLLAINWLLMSFAHAWLPLAASLTGIVLAYPVWSWRSQEAALQHIDKELATLQADRMLVVRHGDMPWQSAADHSLSARVVRLHHSVDLLRQAVRQREEVLHFISHDMRSPQNSILALIALQRAGHEGLSDSEFYSRLEHYARSTLGLVDGFVHLARAEAAAMNLQEQNLVDLAATTCDERWPRAAQLDSTIQFSSAVENAYARVDGGLLARALGNLLDNALQYSPAGSTVQCGLRREGRWWCISVRDQGPGIPADQCRRIFMPFVRINDNARAQPPGSGLGLAFVQIVAQRHGGGAECNSVMGEGSEFVLRLPADAAPEPV